MRSKFWMVLAGLMVVAAPLAAQEREDEALVEEERDEERAEPAFRLKVLDNPYDISSFYRSGQGRGGFLLGDGYEGRGGNAYRDPYAIAGYYRSNSGRGGYGYSQFWVSGYSGRSRGLRYRRHIGENGDLFLFAPAILAPVGPLSEVFLSGR
jgi:hypothetical protein